MLAGTVNPAIPIESVTFGMDSDFAFQESTESVTGGVRVAGLADDKPYARAWWLRIGT